MIKLSKYLSILAISTTCVMSQDSFVKGLYYTGVALQAQEAPGTSFSGSALGANFAVQSVASFVDPSEKNLINEIKNHTNAESDPEELGALGRELSEHMKLGVYAYTHEAAPPSEKGMAKLTKTGAINIPINFNDSQGSAKTINDQVEKDTEGRIKNLVKADDIDCDTVLGLLNTIFVKADWANSFKEGSMQFRTADEREISVKCLRGATGLRNLETKTATFVVLDTSNRTFSLILKLPKDKKNVTPVSYEDVVALQSQGKDEFIRVFIPHANLETSHDLKAKMKGTLPNLLGDKRFSTTLFPTEVAVGAFKQKSVVKWNHTGFEGAAATFMGVYSKCIRRDPEPNKTITFDRPFSALFVYNNDENMQIPVFFGQVADASGLVLASN